MDVDKIPLLRKGGKTMAIRSKDEILEAVKGRIGEQTDDDTIAFLEDITDTFSDLETRANGDGTDWKSMYEENDKAWRTKYTERFFSQEPKQEQSPEEEKTPEPMTFDDLFKEED